MPQLRAAILSLLALIVLVALSGCGSGVHGAYPTADNFEKFVLRFQDYASQYGRGIPHVDDWLRIRFGPTASHDVAGTCEWDFLQGREIVVNQDEWDSIDDDSRESLLFHELGHCILHRDHDDGTLPATEMGGTEKDDAEYPRSLMNPRFVDGATYKMFQEHYLKELFGK